VELQSLHPVDERQSWIGGDVVVDPSAVIGPGVLLQADGGCRIAIAAGVIIGMGSVLHARSGAIAVGRGATLGAGVLLVGAVTVGSGARLGMGVTVIDAQVPDGQLVLPGALLGGSAESIDSTESAASPPPAPVPQPSPEPAIADDTNSNSDPKPSDHPPSPSENLGHSPDPEETPPKRVIFSSQFSAAATAFSVGFTDPSVAASSPRPHPAPAAPKIPDLPSPQPFQASQAVEADGSNPPNGSIPPIASAVAPDPDPSPDADGAFLSVHRPSSTPLYGKSHLDRLMTMMFPHRNGLGDRGEPPESPEPLRANAADDPWNDEV
jgi:carbon dioxide concentrating mechanism protein CcmN